MLVEGPRAGKMAFLTQGFIILGWAGCSKGPGSITESRKLAPMTSRGHLKTSKVGQAVLPPVTECADDSSLSVFEVPSTRQAAQAPDF